MSIACKRDIPTFFHLSALPAEVYQILLSYVPSVSVLALWKVGDGLLQQKLRSNVHYIDLKDENGFSTSRFPQCILCFSALKSLIIRRPLSYLASSGPSLSRFLRQLPPSLLALHLFSADALEGLLEPEADWTAANHTYKWTDYTLKYDQVEVNWPSRMWDLNATFPSLKSLSIVAPLPWSPVAPSNTPNAVIHLAMTELIALPRSLEALDIHINPTGPQPPAFLLALPRTLTNMPQLTIQGSYRDESALGIHVSSLLPFPAEQLALLPQYARRTIHHSDGHSLTSIVPRQDIDWKAITASQRIAFQLDFLPPHLPQLSLTTPDCEDYPAIFEHLPAGLKLLNHDAFNDGASPQTLQSLPSSIEHMIIDTPNLRRFFSTSQTQWPVELAHKFDSLLLIEFNHSTPLTYLHPEEIRSLPPTLTQLKSIALKFEELDALELSETSLLSLWPPRLSALNFALCKCSESQFKYFPRTLMLLDSVSIETKFGSLPPNLTSLRFHLSHSATSDNLKNSNLPRSLRRVQQLSGKDVFPLENILSLFDLNELSISAGPDPCYDIINLNQMKHLTSIGMPSWPWNDFDKFPPLLVGLSIQNVTHHDLVSGEEAKYINSLPSSLCHLLLMRRGGQKPIITGDPFSNLHCLSYLHLQQLAFFDSSTLQFLPRNIDTIHLDVAPLNPFDFSKIPPSAKLIALGSLALQHPNEAAAYYPIRALIYDRLALNAIAKERIAKAESQRLSSPDPRIVI